MLLIGPIADILSPDDNDNNVHVDGPQQSIYSPMEFNTHLQKYK